MLLDEAGLLDQVSLVASDISARVLAHARAGVYRRRSLRSIPPGVIGRWLEGDENGMRVAPHITRAITFQRVNLVDEHEPSALGSFDVIICRNVLIYFQRSSDRASGRPSLAKAQARRAARGRHLRVPASFQSGVRLRRARRGFLLSKAAEMSAIRVLVVDDSAFARKVVRESLQTSPEIEVVGIARDGIDALEKIAELKPDVITLDLVMPNLDGLGVLAALTPAQRSRVVIVSMADGESDIGISALGYGVFDLVHKPTTLAVASLHEIADELVSKVLLAAAQPPARDLESAVEIPVGPTLLRHSDRVVLIGTSTGGPQALTRLLKAFPADFPAPIAIVLHIPAGYTGPLAERLNGECAIEVLEATEGLELRPGRAILAQAGIHLRIVETADVLTVQSRDGAERFGAPTVGRHSVSKRRAVPGQTRARRGPHRHGQRRIEGRTRDRRRRRPSADRSRSIVRRLRHAASGQGSRALARRSAARTDGRRNHQPHLGAELGYASRALAPRDGRRATELTERRAQRLIERCVRLLAQEGAQFFVVELEPEVPQVPHLDHLSERLDERGKEVDEEPRKSPDARAGDTGHAPRRFGDFNTALEPMTFEVEHFERSELGFSLHQLHDRFREVRQVGPSVADFTLAGVDQRAQRLTWLDQGLAEPTILRSCPEKVARAHNQHASAFASRPRETLLHRHTDHALSSFRLLRCRLGHFRKCLGTVIVDGARQHQPRVRRSSRGDAVLQHRQREALPISVPGWIGRVDDEAHAN